MGVGSRLSGRRVRRVWCETMIEGIHVEGEESHGGLESRILVDAAVECCCCCCC